jgi:hypothetical protein
MHPDPQQPASSQAAPVDIDEMENTKLPETRHRRGDREPGDKHESTQVVSRRARASAESNICEQCCNLDLMGALQKAAQIRERDTTLLGTELDHGIRIAKVGHRFRQPRRPTDCTLCAMLFDSHSRRDLYSTVSDEGDEIRLFPYFIYSRLVRVPSIFCRYDSAMLAVVSSQFGSKPHVTFDEYVLLMVQVLEQGAAIIHRNEDYPAVLAAQEVPDVFDADVVKIWMEYCKSNHSMLCGVSNSSLVPGLRLIDCWNLSIIESEGNEEYVALSYVWGKACYINSTVRRTRRRLILPAKLSAVISDAIIVTKALGFRYLWVDRFCIDQDDPDGKYQQIKQMDAIYEDADLVLVAAAGADETYGLPGVSRTPRTPQTTARFNGMRVISTMKDPHFSIQSSKWASRGWTFQEAALSRRRLVFTDQQLYFECNSMNCFESIYSPLDKMHREDKSRFLDGIRGGIFRRQLWYGEPTPDMVLADAFTKYWSDIEEYSSRDLRYDSDTLAAFQGVIRRYSKSHFNALWGMPYPTQREERIKYFCLSLTWCHRRSCWESAKPLRRRLEFPSWTWAGWDSKATLPFMQGIFSSQLMLSIQSIRFGARGEEEDLESLNYTTSELKWHVLRVRGKALRPSLFLTSTKYGVVRWIVDGRTATLFPSYNCMLEAQFLQELMDTGQWRCIPLCHFGSGYRHIYAMVIKRNQNGNTWTRAGVFDIAGSNVELGSYYLEAEWYDIE